MYLFHFRFARILKFIHLGRYFTFTLLLNIRKIAKKEESIESKVKTVN